MGFHRARFPLVLPSLGTYAAHRLALCCRRLRSPFRRNVSSRTQKVSAQMMGFVLASRRKLYDLRRDHCSTLRALRSSLAVSRIISNPRKLSTAAAER